MAAAAAAGNSLSFLTNIYLWIGTTMLFLLLFVLLLIFVIVLSKKTHAIVELKAWMKGRPIALFFLENRYCEWKPVTVEAGIIQDKDYGAYIVNEKATYVDKRTKAVLLPFDAAIAAGVNVHAAKLMDDLQYIVQDEEEMKKLRYAIANGMIDDAEPVMGLRTTINFGAIKNMMTALIPHNINAKIEKTIAARLKNYGQTNVAQIALLFAAIFGAILLGALVIKLAFK
jgi:hypothetical protein